MHERTLHINKFSNSLYAELANAFIDDDGNDDARLKVSRACSHDLARPDCTQSPQPTAVKPFDRPPGGAQRATAWQLA